MAQKSIYKCKDCGNAFEAVSGSLMRACEVRCEKCDKVKYYSYADDLEFFDAVCVACKQISAATESKTKCVKCGSEMISYQLSDRIPSCEACGGVMKQGLSPMCPKCGKREAEVIKTAIFID